MNYRELDKKARELHTKYKSLQTFLKDQNLVNDKEKTLKLNEYEKKTYNQFLFYNGMKKALSKMTKERNNS